MNIGKQEGDYNRTVSVIVNGVSQGLSVSSLASLTNLTEAQVLNIIEEHMES